MRFPLSKSVQLFNNFVTTNFTLFLLFEIVTHSPLHIALSLTHSFYSFCVSHCVRVVIVSSAAAFGGARGI